MKMEKWPVACITVDRERVVAGGIPVFIADNEEEMEQMATIMSRVLDAAAHDLGNGVVLVVQH